LHQIRSSLMSGLELSITDIVLKSIPEVQIAGDTIALRSHKAFVDPNDLVIRERLTGIYRQAGLQPSTLQEAATMLSMEPAKVRSHLEALLKERTLVRIGTDMILHTETLVGVRSALNHYRGRRFSVSEFKTWTGISRKYAIPLLEYLDREHTTRREGDMRIVV
jgi:selenocysteine-specific elongation factor